MVDKNFIGLDKPDITRFESYLPTAFSSELTLLQKVNKIIQDLNQNFDLSNEMVDYLNRFIETFDEKLYGTLDDVLNVWLDDGRLATITGQIIGQIETFKNDIDNKVTQQNLTINQFEEEVNSNINQFKTVVDKKVSDNNAFQEQRNLHLYASNKDTKSIAHRGVTLLSPENSIPSITDCVLLGYKYVEIDIHLTKDKQWILMHDSSIDRTTTGNGSVSSYNYSEILSFSLISSRFSNLKVPRLEDALRVCNIHNIIPVIEVKDGNASNSDLSVIISLMKEYGFYEKGIIISFNHGLMESLRGLDNYINISLLSPIISNDLINKAINITNCGISVDLSGLNNSSMSMLKDIKRNNIPFTIWTIKSSLQMSNALNYYPDFVTTDNFLNGGQ